MIGHNHIGKNGRFGNQMFQYAATRGISQVPVGTTSRLALKHRVMQKVINLLYLTKYNWWSKV